MRLSEVLQWNAYGTPLFFVILVSSMNFKEKVFAFVKKIPQGTTMTYKEVAEHIGHPQAYRAVDNMLHTNYACHRVIRSDGTLGGYNRGHSKKKEMLTKERDIMQKNNKYI